ncbi:hypothetical protein BBJ28_00018342 [Nothophytophthora sp. Chile5]|nr:hypothetical protein BBJ28_00018342 [Nothophytophthora sp. Chile5]
MQHSTAGLSMVKTVQASAYAQTHTTSSVVNFGIGQPSPSLLPVSMFRAAAAQRFQSTQDPVVLQYGAAKGYIGFREEIANVLAGTVTSFALVLIVLTTKKKELTAFALMYQGTQADPIDPEALMVTAGNSQAISHAAMVLTKNNKRVFVEEPTYFLAHDIFRELGLDLRGIHVGKQGIDLDVLEEQLIAGNVPAFLYTIPFFHNPTGAVLAADRCKRLVALAQKYGFHIISDEPYNLLSLDGDSLPSLASYDDSGLATMCAALRELCPQVEFAEPLGGYFVWLQLPDGVEANALLEEAQVHHGVAFTPGPRCSLGALYGDGDGGVPAVNGAMARCVRLSFAFYDEDEIRMGIQRLQRALRVIESTRSGGP